MLLSEEELERLHKRFPYPRFSPAEYQRRYANIRGMMQRLNLDCLLIIGGSAAYGRLWFNFRYVTNMMGKAEMASYCFFPKEGESRDRKSTRLNSSHSAKSRMPSSA